MTVFSWLPIEAILTKKYTVVNHFIENQSHSNAAEELRNPLVTPEISRNSINPEDQGFGVFLNI